MKVYIIHYLTYMKVGMNIMSVHAFSSCCFSTPCHNQYQHGGHANLWGGNDCSAIQCWAVKHFYGDRSLKNMQLLFSWLLEKQEIRAWWSSRIFIFMII